MITLSENFRALFYTPFYAAHAIGAYEAEHVDVRLRNSPDPARTAADLRAGRIDVMWGGPLRVLLTHAADPASDSCVSATWSRATRSLSSAANHTPISGHAIWSGSRFASVAEVPTPWLCLQDDIRRDGADPAAGDAHPRSLPWRKTPRLCAPARSTPFRCFNRTPRSCCSLARAMFGTGGGPRADGVYDIGHPSHRC